MRGLCVAGAVLSLASVVGGCAATTPTSKVAVDYNRIFAKARNEVLVTNILRAAAREPLQFSTMGSVTGGVRNSGSIDLNIASLIGKGATILSPDLVVNEGINPNVTIVPLSSKEFTEGILRPVTLDEINYFINQGWDQELVLELAIGGLVCPDGNVVLNHGDPSSDADYDAFARMLANAGRFPVQQAGTAESMVIRMTASDALTAMKDGVGAGRSVKSVNPVVENGRRTNFVDVTIASTPAQELRGLRTSEVCRAKQNPVVRDAAAPNQKLVAVLADGRDQGKVILRSVESIIYFLGETQRHRWRAGDGCSRGAPDNSWPYYTRIREVNGEDRVEHLTLLRLDKTCSDTPVVMRTFLQTHFNDGYYYLRRQSDAGDRDRSLTTLSLLDEMIALQTSESTVAAGAPIIAIGAR